MKKIFLIIIASFIMMTFTVQAEDVTKLDYQSEVLDLLNQYGEDFDDCFEKLPSDFPSLPCGWRCAPGRQRRTLSPGRGAALLHWCAWC